jgi:hypothetical protein
MEGTKLYRGLWEKGEILFPQEIFLIGESERYVKSKLLETGSYLRRGPVEVLQEGSFTGDFEGQYKSRR